MSQGNNRITGWSPAEDPVLTVSQKLETSNQTNDSLQRRCVARGVRCGTLWHTTQSTMKMVFLCFVVVVCACFYFGEEVAGAKDEEERTGK